MHDYEDDEDLDGSEEREALGMVLANMGDSVKRLRRNRLQGPAVVKKVEVTADGLNDADPVATGDAELTDAELAALEELC